MRAATGKRPTAGDCRRGQGLGVRALALLGLVGAVARLFNLGTYSLWLDEILLTGRASGSLAQVWQACLANAEHPPLSALVSALVLAVAPSETALRLLGVRDFSFVFQSESAGAVLELVRHSDFLTVLPRYAVRAAKDRSLAILPVQLPTSDQTIAMISHAERDETKLSGEFKAHMRDHVRAYARDIVAPSHPNAACVRM